MPPLFTVKMDARIGSWLLSSLKRKTARPRRLMRLVVGEVAKLARDNFRRLNSSRSKYGHKFYITEGEKKTTSDVEKDGLSGVVKIDSVQMLHKLKGGTVYPKNKFLAIPVTEWAKSQKQTPGDIYGIDLYNFGKRPFLAREGKDGQPKEGGPDWILLRSVTHKPHPEVLPSRQDIDAVVRHATRLYEDSLEKEWLKNT